MRLYEFESKQLLRKHGIKVPAGILSTSTVSEMPFEDVVVKAQVLSGGRGKAGAIKAFTNIEEAKNFANSLLGSIVLNEKVKSVLLERKTKTKEEFYMSFLYDTDSQLPVLLLSKNGGVDVAELAKGNLVKKPIDPLLGLKEWQARDAAVDAGFPSELIPRIAEFALRLYSVFLEEDCRLLEINPLSLTEEGELVSVGALIELDNDAGYKHKDRSYPPRIIGVGRELTERELSVKQADESDYRGSVKFIELGGDIGFLAGGGGGSMAAMDALILAGGNPANYAEFSGDPPKEKVYALAKAILGQPGLKGLWIVGSIANFTRVDHTMQGVVEALREIKPKYPIVVRRSGPYEKEGLQLLRDVGKELGLNIEVHGSEIPMTSTAKTIMERVK